MPKSMKLPHKKKSSRYESLSRYNEGGLASSKTNMGVDPRAKQQKTVVATEDKFNRYKTRIT
jgi:hypothetical protein